VNPTDETGRYREERANEDHGQELHRHTYEIYVNGRKKTVHGNRVSFDEAVKLAFDPVPTGPTVYFLVTYRKAAHDKHGSLQPGQSVEIKNGTVFDVEQCDRS
jgi:hypothetical protein